MTGNNHGKKSISSAKRVLLFIVGIVVALAVAVTCALFYNNEAQRVNVNEVENTPTTSRALSNTTGDQTATGALVAGDVITYTYSGGVRSITLPAGTYTLRANGAQGGVSPHCTTANNTGGSAWGTFEITSNTTLYIAVGGKGADGSSGYLGGWNGGGHGGHKGTDTAGGGGATHIARTNNRGELRNYNSYRSEVLVVGGGGGGNGCSSWVGGQGGGSAGTAGAGGSSYAPGGVQGTATAAGATRGNGTAAGFGYGGSTSTSTSLYGCGGGGGGWFGGSAGNNISGGGASGGGGSGYVNTSALTSAGYTVGGTSGNGTATITVVKVNQPPTTRNYTVSAGKRGAVNVNVAASTLASDPEGTALYFTNGTSGAYDTFTPTANAGIYLDTACTVSANKYIRWTWTASSGLYSTFNINRVLKYPRAGIDGCTTNGTIPMYVKIRDNYYNSASRGWAVIKFFVSVTPETVNRVTATFGSGDNQYFVGMSNASATVPEIDASATSIYNPNGGSRYTLIFKKSLKRNTPFTISAAGLLSGIYAGVDGLKGDKIFFTLNSTTAITGSSRKFRIEEYSASSSPHKATIYNSSKVQVANAFDQLTFVCEAPDPAFQVFQVRLYTVEQDTVYTDASNVSAGIGYIDLDIVFKMDNARPKIKDGTAPVVNLNALASKTVSLSEFYSDADSSITSTTHTIRSIKVPTNEYIQLDKYDKVVSTLSGGTSYFNVVPGSAGLAATMFDDAKGLSGNGELKGSYATGFDAAWITSSSSPRAYVQYSFSGDRLTLTGLRATYNMYRSDRGSGKIITGRNADGTAIAQAGTIQPAGHFYILINIQDKNDVEDNGIWVPLGITVGNATPTEMSTERGAAGQSVMPTASGAPGRTVLFSPMGITYERSAYALGVYLNDKGVYTNEGLSPLAADSDNFLASNMLDGPSVFGSSDAGKLNELIQITSSMADIRSSVSGNATGEYFDVSEFNLYVPKKYFTGRVTGAGLTSASINYRNNASDALTDCYVIKGLAVTLNNWTHNRNLFATVNVRDTSGASNGTASVRIAVNVSNSSPTNIAAENVAKVDYKYNGKTVKIEAKDASSSVATVQYYIPVNSTVFITPYDLITDNNLIKNGIKYPSGGFTLNGLSGMYNTESGEFVVDGTPSGATDVRTRVEAVADSTNLIGGGIDYSHSSYRKELTDMLDALKKTRTFTNALSASNLFAGEAERTKETRVEGLFFARTTDSEARALDGYNFNPYASSDRTAFAAPSIIGASFISKSFGTRLTIGGTTYDLDYIAVTATSLTQSITPVVIELDVRDRMGAGASGTASGVTSIRIEINVINSTPSVRRDDLYTLATTPYNPAGGEATDRVDVTDAGQAISVYPTTMVFYASNYSGEESYKNFLKDNENDSIYFYPAGEITIVDDQGRSADENGRDYLNNFLRVSISDTTLTITALNSTQTAKMLYVCFYTTDGRATNGLDLDNGQCRIRVQVVNSAFTVNTGDDGFEADETTKINTWTVDSLSNADVRRERYFASGEGATKALKSSGIASGQIKTVVKDSDALQGVVLSPVSSFGDSAGRTFYNAAKKSDGTFDYKTAVPFISTQGENYAGGRIFLGDSAANISGILQGGTPSEGSTYVSNYDVLYFIFDGNGGYTTYSARTLRSESDTTFNNPELVKKFFDEQGRWIVTDWAVRIVPYMESDPTHYISLRLYMRDETRFGGSTAGMNTAYRNGVAASIDGFKSFDYRLYINGTGIVPYTYYNQFDGYYTVADAVDSSKRYISTFDDDNETTYATAQNNLYLTADNKITTTATSTLLKNRASGEPDNSFAGIHSGAEYVAGTDYSKEYTGKESAFRYSDTIKVSGDSTKATAVPMSYFALLNGIVTPMESSTATPGRVVYPTSSYVAYDLPQFNTTGYLRSSTSQVAYAVSISDGIETWTGSDEGDAHALNKNPYVTVTAYDAYSTVSGLEVANPYYLNSYNGDYFNKHLAVPTVDGDGNTLSYITTTHADTRTANAKNLIGNSGQLMYLAEQASQLQENMFGLSFVKNKTRSAAATLTVTISVARCMSESSTTKTAYGETATAKDKNTAKVTFKLEIGNSPLTLQQTTSGARYDATSGYFTEVNLTTGGGAYTVGLARYGDNDDTTSIGSTAAHKIYYNDDDKVETKVGGKDIVQTAVSDKAYFYRDSLNAFGSWSGEAYKRVLAYVDNVDTAATFVNTSTATVTEGTNVRAYPQISMRNYLKASAKTEVDAIGGTYQPNGGIYGTNRVADVRREGYSSYFTVALSSDGTALNITPLAKTIINDDIIKSVSDKSAYYAERGLVYNAEKNTAYYPLKVLIYDSHGEGFNTGSYVALEIRITVKGSAPKLSRSLETDTKNGTDGAKKIDIALAVDGTYNFNIANVVESNELLYKTSNGARQLFWKSDYDSLLSSLSKPDVSDTEKMDARFRLETGSYLKSPFADTRYYSWVNPNDNESLIAGTALLYNETGNAVSSQPDVIMFMDYDIKGGSGFNSSNANNIEPADNTVKFRVNRRTVSRGAAVNSFSFTIFFTDNEGNSTSPLTIYLTVTNRTPYARAATLGSGMDNSQKLKMRVNDTFTVLTTPYDRFLGSERKEGGKYVASASAAASTSYNTVINNPTDLRDRYLCRVRGDDGYATSTHFEDLDSVGLETDGKQLRNYNPDITAAQHLGYVAIADDDTPWALRIESVSFYDNSCFSVPVRERDRLTAEGTTLGRMYPLDVTITALSVCTNMPVTITVIDGDGARFTFTMYVTVESSKPSAIPDGDTLHPRAPGLITTYDGEYENPGVFGMYMTTDSESTHVYNNVNVRKGADTEKIDYVYGQVKLDINKIAYDPDTTDNNNISLYTEGGGFNIFTLNGMNMKRDGNTYSNDVFEITAADDLKSFTVTCKTFNPNRDNDELRFYIRDCGNNIFDNAIPITIRIITLYSEMTNPTQSANATVTAGTINSRYVNTVFVKPFDDYIGTSEEVKALETEEERTAVVGVDSTYQFLTYADMPKSIDQIDDAGAAINPPLITDRDVSINDYNLLYNVRIYALMNRVEGQSGVFESMKLDKASALFNIADNPADRAAHYMYFKETASVSDYLVGGRYANGGAVRGINTSLVKYINNFFLFELGDDGVSVSFRPVTSNIDTDILFYVQVEKSISTSRRIAPNNVCIKSGTLFYVKVKDSAPVVNTDKSVLEFGGYKNDSHIFTIYDAGNPFDSMFTDSDAADSVVVNGFISSGNPTADYAEALKDADCDWQIGKGKARAIDIEINNEDLEKNGIPAHSLKLTIRRRIDKTDEDGNYLSDVTFPVYITGKDKNGRTATATLSITIKNSDFDLDADKLENNASNYSGETNEGYTVSKSDTAKKTYVFDAAVAPDSEPLAVNLVADRWLSDIDFTSMDADNDSFRLVRPSTDNAHMYLYDGELEMFEAGADIGAEAIATLTPKFGANGKDEDANHFVGFTVKAKSYIRNKTAIAYMRIIDRSGNAISDDSGITIMVRVTVLNAAPSINPDHPPMEFTVSGSGSKTPTPIEIDVTKYVIDKNGDPLHIISMLPLTPDFNDIHCTNEDDNGGNIFDVNLVANTEERVMTIAPRRGFYGTQDVQIMVADGSLTTDVSARTVSFTIRVNIVYDFDQIIDLNTINAIRSLPTKVTPEILFRDIADTYDISVLASGNTSARPRTVLASADETRTFNPGKNYVITDLKLNSLGSVDIRKDADDDWSFTASREGEITFNVTFMRKVDVGTEGAQTFSRTFNAVIGKNTAPQLLENFKRETGYTFKTGVGDYGLDGNGTVAITTSMLFNDIDIVHGDRLLFDPANTEIVSPTICSVRFSDDGTIMYLTFNYRGETDLTVGIKDRTGETTRATIHVKNIDRPEPNFFGLIKVSVETYPFIWIAVAAGLLLLIFLLILIILLVKRRKRKREELEAILISEMELEEQMLRIANTSSAMAYQSYGFLPPTMSVANDPGMMLGAGGGAPTPDTVALNPGQQGNNGVPNDSDM